MKAMELCVHCQEGAVVHAFRADHRPPTFEGFLAGPSTTHLWLRLRWRLELQHLVGQAAVGSHPALAARRISCTTTSSNCLLALACALACIEGLDLVGSAGRHARTLINCMVQQQYSTQQRSTVCGCQSIKQNDTYQGAAAAVHAMNTVCSYHSASIIEGDPGPHTVVKACK
jgi:hypothetical protein